MFCFCFLTVRANNLPGVSDNKKDRHLNRSSFNSGAYGDRTRDLMIANHALSQLS